MPDYFIILIVLLPLCAAPLCVLLSHRRLAWGAATLTCWASFAIAVTLLHHVLVSGPVTYMFGGWPVPMGIGYKIDLFNAMMLVLVTFIASVILPYAAQSITIEIQKEKQSVFYAVVMLYLTGINGILATNDAFNLYVFLEIASLATYALIAMGKSRRSLMSSFEYLVLGTIGATFYLIGIGLLYAMTGTLNIDDLAVRIKSAHDIQPLQAAFAFITLGLAMKMALFPLHQWLTNAYTYAPACISALLASTSTKISLYVLIRITFSLFGFDFAFNDIPFSAITGCLGILAMLAGSLLAIYQTDVKRMLAFSSVAQVGYIILGFSFATETGLTASITHMINDSLAKGCLFLVAGALLWQKADTSLYHLNGSAKQMPLCMAAMVIACASIVGIPFTGGFVSKWYFLFAAIRQDMWLSVVAILGSTIMASIYCWKLVEAAYVKDTLHPISAAKPLPLSMVLSIWMFTGAVIYVGIDTSFSVYLAEKVAIHFIQGATW
ncbi:MAG: monovalent cation/H+ antiporter subunit D family protein [Alphaproteobacteria bacterium]|nr:monovalent cation/H+ antiporter subunit D family protein [Alphaproteobacteria bacterium]